MESSTNPLAERRNLVARAKAAGIANPMKMKSADIHAQLAEIEESPMTDVDTTEYVESPSTGVPVDNTTENADPEAPYGRKADGTPKGKPGPKKSAGSATRTRASAPRPTRKSGPGRGRMSAQTDYRAGIVGVLQIPAFGLITAGKFNPALEYDGIALATMAPAFASALNDLAAEDARTAAILDKVLAIGPYGAILGVVVPFIAQVAVNHKKIPAGTLGTVEPEVLKTSFAAGE